MYASRTRTGASAALLQRATTILARHEQRSYNNNISATSQQLLHTYAYFPHRDDDDGRAAEQERTRLRSLPSVASYHTTTPTERGAAIVLGLGAISAAAFAASHSVNAYKEWKAAQPEKPPEVEEPRPQEETTEQQQQQQQQQKQQEASSEGKRENIFAKWFNVGVGSKYYEGGFDDKMTRKEAALILGVRESSSAQRIKEAHRQLLILNHPDTGGSTYMAGKINEAKELLLKGKKLGA